MPERRTRRRLTVAPPVADETQTPDATETAERAPARPSRRGAARKEALAALTSESADNATPMTRRGQAASRLRQRKRLSLTTSSVSSVDVMLREERGNTASDAQAAATPPKAEPETPKFELLDPRRYLGADNHMRIDRDDWKALQARFHGDKGRSALVKLLEDIVTVNKIEAPMRMITRDEALSEFKALKALDTASIFSANRTQSRYYYKSTMGLLTIAPENAGNLTSDYLFQGIRWTCRGGRVLSPIESWDDPKARRAIFHHMIDAEVPYVDRHRLRKHLGTRRYIPTPYRPATAKALFDFIRPEAVLDLSFGWGERLVGFEASSYPKRYFGIDPDKRVLDQGHKLHKLCRQTSKSVELYHTPAEDFTYGILDPVDMIYFAPPPFNTERYTEEDTQVHQRYTTERAFLKDFLMKSIVKSWEALKAGGTLALDLGDLRAPQHEGGRYELVDPLIHELLKALPDAVFRGSVGASVSKHKPVDDFASVRVDPIWILTKGHMETARRSLFGRKRAAKIDEAQGL